MSDKLRAFYRADNAKIHLLTLIYTGFKRLLVHTTDTRIIYFKYSETQWPLIQNLRCVKTLAVQYCSKMTQTARCSDYLYGI